MTFESMSEAVAYRKARKVSQREAAHHLSMSPIGLSNWEKRFDLFLDEYRAAVDLAADHNHAGLLKGMSATRVAAVLTPRQRQQLLHALQVAERRDQAQQKSGGADD